jgi:hypothetical protein
MRAAADARERRVEACDAELERRIDVCERQAARVMKVPAAEAVADDAERLLEKLAHHSRVRVADRIGESHTIGPGVEDSLHQSQDFLRLDATLDRASEGSGHADFDDRAGTGGIPRCADARHLRHLPRPAACAGWRGCAHGLPRAGTSMT